jgi:hypothetical protein
MRDFYDVERHRIPEAIKISDNLQPAAARETQSAVGLTLAPEK